MGRQQDVEAECGRILKACAGAGVSTWADLMFICASMCLDVATPMCCLCSRLNLLACVSQCADGLLACNAQHQAWMTVQYVHKQILQPRQAVGSCDARCSFSIYFMMELGQQCFKAKAALYLAMHSRYRLLGPDEVVSAVAGSELCH